MKITILYYGAFRAYGEQVELNVDFPTSVQRIKTILGAHLGAEHQALIEDSVLANETDILPDEFVLDAECTLSILPPVCGG